MILSYILFIFYILLGSGPKIPPLPLSGVGKGSHRYRNGDELDTAKSLGLSRRSSRSEKKSRRNSMTNSRSETGPDLNQYGPSSNVDGRYYSGGPSSRRTSSTVKFARNSETQTESARSRNSMSQTESVKKRDSSMQTMTSEELEKSEKKLQESMEKVVTSLASSTFSLSGKERSNSQQFNSQVQMFTTDDLDASEEGKGSSNNAGTQSMPVTGVTSAGNLHGNQRHHHTHGRKNTMKEFDMYSHDSLDDEEENYRHMSPIKRNELIQQAIKVLLAEDGMVDGRQGMNRNGRTN